MKIKIGVFILCIAFFVVLCRAASTSTPTTEEILPIVTPGSIDSVAPDLKMPATFAADWRFDPTHILFLQGSCPVGLHCLPYELLLLDIQKQEMTPLKISEEGKQVSWPAQGKNDLVAYNVGDYLYLYNAQSHQKIFIGFGYKPDFSPSGDQIVYMAGIGELNIFDIAENRVVKNITFFPENPSAGNHFISGFPEHSSPGDHSISRVTWRGDGKGLYALYCWSDSKSNYLPFHSEIWEIDLESPKRQMIYQSKYIEDFSLSPGALFFAIDVSDYPNDQSFVVLFDPKNNCVIENRTFPKYSSFVRWSPSGEFILLSFDIQNHPYIINIEKTFGVKYSELKCK